MIETAAPHDPAPAPTSDSASPHRSVRRAVVWVTLGSFGIAALMGIAALLSGGAFGEREGQVLLTTLVVGCTSVAMLCYLATGATRFQWVGVVGGVVVLVPALVALLLVWNGDAWEGETIFQVFGVGLVAAATVAQLSLLLGVAGDRRRLHAVLWPTVVLAVAVAVVVSGMIIGEPGSDGVLRLLGVMAILDVLGTVTTLALAIFGNRAADEPGVPVRLPAGLHARLDLVARESGRPRDQIVAQAVEEWLSARA